LSIFFLFTVSRKLLQYFREKLFREPLTKTNNSGKMWSAIGRLVIILILWAQFFEVFRFLCENFLIISKNTP